MPPAVLRRSAIAALSLFLLTTVHAQAGQIVENVQAARRSGVGGIILFSYDALADATHGPGYVSQVGRAAFQF